MTPFAPSSDVATSGSVTLVGASSVWGCTDQLVSGDPDYAQISADGSFTVGMTGRFASWGRGDGLLWIRYNTSGSSLPQAVVTLDGTDFITLSIQSQAAFGSVAFAVPSMPAGTTLTVKVQNTIPDGPTKVSWMQFQVPQPNVEWPIVGVRPKETDYPVEMQVCSRTHYLTAPSDIVIAGDGRQYSRTFGNPPKEDRNDRS